MDEKYKKLLQKNHKFLVNNMSNVEEVCNYLWEKELIQLGAKQEIMKQKPVPHGQIRHLLSLIPRCGPKAFDELMQSFRESGNQHLVDQLIGKQDTKVPTMEGPSKEGPTKEDPYVKPKEEPNEPMKGEPNPVPEKVLPWPLETSMVKSIQTCDPNDPNIPLQGTTVYNMTSAKKRGKVLMFKNFGTSENKDYSTTLRQHIDTDSTNVDQVFKLADFATKSFKDKSKQDILKFLNKYTEEKEIRDFDCFFLFLLSVGDNPHEFYVNKETVLTLNDIMKILTDRPALKSKPKIIIMQTCSVEDWNSAAGGDQVDSRVDSNINNDDLFVVCSTPVKGVNPWINVGDMTGSWFIQAFVHVFKEFAHKLPFLKLLEKIDSYLGNARYKDESGVEINRRVASVNIITKCDRKQLYFFPGIQSQPTTPTAQPGICWPQPTSVPPSDGEIQSTEVSSSTGDKDTEQMENKGKGNS